MEKKSILKSSYVVLIVVLLMGTTVSSGSVDSKSISNNDKDKAFVDDPSTSTGSDYRLNTVSFIRNIFNKSSNGQNQQFGLFTSTIYTECDDIKKSTDITFGLFNDINVDNDENTGEDGNDIRVQYLLLPWIEFEPVITVGILFTVSIERIGEEIKDRNFNISLESSDANIKIGFWSPSEAGNEIPDSTRISFMFLFNPFEKISGFRFFINPEYSTGAEDKKIVLFADYNDEGIERSFSFEYDPPIETQITVISTREEGQWQYNFNRKSSLDSKVTACFKTLQGEDEKETIFSIDKLPLDLSFEIGLTPFGEEGGRFIYESSEMYDIEFMVTTSELGVCKYATMRNTPTKILADWTPTLMDGSYSLSIESDGTDFMLKNSLIDPTINLTVNNIESIDIDASWNLTNPGDFTVGKNSELDIDLEFDIGEWIVKLNAKPTANYLSTSWLIDVTGYLRIDTNDQLLSTVDLLIKGGDFGLKTIGESFKTEDFSLGWTLWPPIEWDLDVSGKLNFLSLAIEIFLNGDWHHLWPLL